MLRLINKYTKMLSCFHARQRFSVCRKTSLRSTSPHPEKKQTPLMRGLFSPFLVIRTVVVLVLRIILRILAALVLRIVLRILAVLILRIVLRIVLRIRIILVVLITHVHRSYLRTFRYTLLECAVFQVRYIVGAVYRSVDDSMSRIGNDIHALKKFF